MNKVSTTCHLRWDVRATKVVQSEVKERLGKAAGSRRTEDGILIIEAKRHRTQEQNREDAIAPLVTLVKKAMEIPKLRKKTRPQCHRIGRQGGG